MIDKDPLGIPQAPGTVWGHTLQGTPRPPRRQQNITDLNKSTATEAQGCCIRMHSLNRITPKTPLDRFVIYATIMEHVPGAHAIRDKDTVHVPPGPSSAPHGLQVA